MNHLTVAVSLTQDGKTLGAVAVETGPILPLRVVRVERIPTGADFRAVTDWLKSRAGDIRAFAFYLPGARDRKRLLVDCGHVLLGRPLVEELWRSEARRKWEIRLDAVELVAVDLAFPQPDGWRVKVSRREVVSALLVTMQTAGLVFVDKSHAAELRGQLEKLTQWREKDDPDGAGGDLAIALALATWDARKTQRRLEDNLPRRTA
jgi:hypothetical protein